MRKMNKKGFTIVELVIVIAVIAILAAVLIPTYSSLVKKANVSADEQAVRQMNTALAIYTAENNKPDNIYEVKKAFDENLINAESLIPVTQGYAFYWDKDENKIVLVGNGGKVQKPESDWLLLSTTGYGDTCSVSNAGDLQSKISASSNENPALINLASHVELTKSEDKKEFSYYNTKKKTTYTSLLVTMGQCVVLDLNGNTLNVGDSPVIVEKGGSLTIKNGTITGNDWVLGNIGGTLTLRDVKITKTRAEDVGMQYTVFVAGISDTSIRDCEISTTAGYAFSTDSGSSENDGARISIVNSKLKTTSGSEDVSSAPKEKGQFSAILVTIGADVEIDNCEIAGVSSGAYLRGCNATITNSKFKHTATEMSTEYSNGCNGPFADLVLASGGSSYGQDYVTNVSFTCNNVEADKVVVNQPEGGTVTISGDIEINHTCHLGKSDTCKGDDATCGND